MHGTTQVDLHPDANSLNGFLEHVLTESERQVILTHLADCKLCREIVYLAHEAYDAPMTAATSETMPLVCYPAEDRSWFRGWRAVWISGAALAAMLAFTISLKTRHSSSPPQLAKNAPPQDNGSLQAGLSKAMDSRKVDGPDHSVGANSASVRAKSPSPRVLRDKIPEPAITQSQPRNGFGGRPVPAGEHERLAIPSQMTARGGFAALPSGSAPNDPKRAEMPSDKGGLTLPKNPASSTLAVRAAPNVLRAPAMVVHHSLTGIPAMSSVKERLAIDKFDFSTVNAAVTAVLGTKQDIGKGIQSMLVDKITKEGKVIAVERGETKQVMNQNDLAGSNRATPQGNVRIGQVGGAHLILHGDIVAFGRDDRRTIGAPAASARFSGSGNFAGGPAPQKTDNAVVSITYRLVDAQTGVVIANGQVRGESKLGSSSLAERSGAFDAAARGAAVDMTSSDFAGTPIGEATTDCVNKLAAILSEQLSKPVTAQVPESVRVASISGSSVTITAGAAQGVSLGDRFQISHVLKTLMPSAIRKTTVLVVENIGVIEITAVKDGVSVGTYSGPDAPRVGDLAAKQSLQSRFP